MPENHDDANITEAADAAAGTAKVEFTEARCSPQPSPLRPPLSSIARAAAPAAKAEEDDEEGVKFADLGIDGRVLAALQDVGYEKPSPIQAATIPLLLEGRDVVGLAQTGTGKTAAFAVPALSRLAELHDLNGPSRKTQALVLAPTRELAIQVAEAFQRTPSTSRTSTCCRSTAARLRPAAAGLRRGVHVIVGTPGRVIDHLDKGSLDLSELKYLVLDEADEMLRMGFIDDVEQILQQTPRTRQVALFSATMPPPDPPHRQAVPEQPGRDHRQGQDHHRRQHPPALLQVMGLHKLDALTRILEAEAFDGVIVFARTKLATEDLADKLQARGFPAAAINGDIPQQQRERTVDPLKKGKIDILVATDVAARGLDVERISHVVNYDIPHDTESYVHRIGRTGRAGRSGEAILFMTPREKYLLRRSRGPRASRWSR